MKAPQAAGSGDRDRGDGVIYVVDDEPMLLDLASAILEPQGYRVETFSSPEAALRAFEVASPRPALIITDYAMHSMTGLELADACRRLEPGQKVLMVSGTVGQDVVQQNERVQPNRFLAKPYVAKQLVEAVRATLAG